MDVRIATASILGAVAVWRLAFAASAAGDADSKALRDAVAAEQV